jgi:NarL family two-component system response regulator LiaR
MKLPMKEKKLVYGVLIGDESFQAAIIGLLKIRPEVGSIIEFSSPEVALKLNSLSQVDFLIIDCLLDGIAFLGQSRVRSLQIPKLILADYNIESKVFDALKYGATGYMLKEEIYSFNKILEILIGNGVYISPKALLRVINYFRKMEMSALDPEHLTERERIVLKEFSEGHASKQIAENLTISIATVRSHIQNIYRKLEVSNQIQLIQRVKEKGLV